MPRQHIHHTKWTYFFPDDFPERLKRFQKESGLSWAEIDRRLETYRHTVWRWVEGRVRPNIRSSQKTRNTQVLVGGGLQAST